MVPGGRSKDFHGPGCLRVVVMAPQPWHLVTATLCPCVVVVPGCGQLGAWVMSSLTSVMGCPPLSVSR